MLRIGLIGTGRAGRNHAAAYRKLAAARLLMVADAAPEAARQVALQCDAQAAPEPASILESPEIDVVDVCVPTFLHREYVLQAARAGKHVICEKPIALTVEDGRAMIEACRRAGVRFFVAHPTRFGPVYRRLKTLLDSGDYGRPLAAKTRRGGRFYPGADRWLDDPAKSGSIMVEAMLHDFDLLRWYFGPVDRVYCAWQVAHEPYYQEAAFATLHFVSGVVAMVEGSRVHNDRFYNTLDVYCSHGVVAYDYRNQTSLRLMTPSFDGRSVTVSASYEDPTGYDQFEAELGHFLTCIESAQTPLVTTEDAVESLAIALAALLSSQTGAPVAL